MASKDFIVKNGLLVGGSGATGSLSAATGTYTTSLSTPSLTAGSIGVDQKICHNGDPTTFINFTECRLRLNVGGIVYLDLDDSTSQPHNLTVNDGSNNVDFIIKGNNNEGEGNPLFKTDASKNRVGINGIGSPEAELEVDGTILATGSDPRIGIGTITPNEALTVSGNVSATGTVYADAFNSKTGGSAIEFNDPVTLSGSLTGVTVCGTTSLLSPLVCGTTKVCTPTVHGTTLVCGATVCGSTSVLSPLVCGTTSVNTPILNGSSCAVAPLLSATNVYTGGSVGIGTNAPNQALTVSGNISASGDIILSEDQRIYFEEIKQLGLKQILLID